MKISIIHPSHGRPEMAFKTAINWLEKAENIKNIEYLLCVDETDSKLGRYMGLLNPKAHVKIDLIVQNTRTAVEAINLGAGKCNGDLMIVVSDDFDCPDMWDSLLQKYLKNCTDFIVKTRDSIQKTLITLPIMDRAYYNRFGYIYHPGYKHMFCDQEMTAVGHFLGRVVDIPLHFNHLHYTSGAMAMDEVNVKNNSTWSQGEILFNMRLKQNFGIINPKIKYEEIIWH